VGALPLAQGELDAEAAAELRVLKEQILRAVGFRCDSYKEKCLRRRIAVRMRARGMHTYADYALLLRTDSAEYERLVDTITINVSKFYRNPEVWEVVREQVLPELYALGSARLHFWSAGCAGGEEPYSIAMLCHEYAEEQGLPLDRHRVLGTDVDARILEFARQGEYSGFAMTDLPDAVRERWFESGSSYRLLPEAKRHVRFERLDLLRDPFPPKQHVIFCRNVIIYFERPLQEELFQRFHEALIPGGFLVLGKVEALFGASAGLFRPVSPRQRVFRRP
jgi:chemotaxis methyl-accepting protein methylase